VAYKVNKLGKHQESSNFKQFVDYLAHVRECIWAERDRERERQKANPSILSKKLQVSNFLDKKFKKQTKPMMNMR
jgi:hypothetical protein